MASSIAMNEVYSDIIEYFESERRHFFFKLGVWGEIIFLVDFRYFLSCPIGSNARIFFFFILEVHLYNLLIVLVSSFCGNFDISFFSEGIKESSCGVFSVHIEWLPCI